MLHIRDVALRITGSMSTTGNATDPTIECKLVVWLWSIVWSVVLTYRLYLYNFAGAMTQLTACD